MQQVNYYTLKNKIFCKLNIQNNHCTFLQEICLTTLTFYINHIYFTSQKKTGKSHLHGTTSRSGE